MSTPLNIADINARLAPRIGDLARQLLGCDPSSRSGSGLRFRTRGSLSIITAGAKVGAWHDHETEEGGDPVALIAYLRRCSMRDARAWALSWLGEAAHRPAPPLPRAAAKAAGCNTLALAQEIWREAVPAAGTLAEAYLCSRHLVLPPAAPIRFHARCPRGTDRLPAMVALMTDPATGEPRGVHRTFLRPDGSGKAAPGPKGERAKMMAGRRGVIRLAEPAARELAIAEGIETSLALMQRRGVPSVWAASCAGAIAGFPVLDGAEGLTVYADADPAGIEAGRACCRRWADAGRAARLKAPKVGDWDDATRPGGAE